MTQPLSGSRLSGKRVLVTGAASGIGEAAARRCASEGAQLVLVDIDDHVHAIAAELGGLAVVLDVRGDDAPVEALERAVEHLSGLDGLANIAGGGSSRAAADMSDALWDRDIDLNLTAVFRWIRAAIPVMQRDGGGSIVNMSSIAGTHALAANVGYVTAKSGLLGLTRSIATDYGRTGIRCNAICPGTIETAGLTAYLSDKPGVASGLMKLNYAGRFGTPEDVASLCLYLLSDESSYVNGAAIPIDGGRAAASAAWTAEGP